MRGIVLVLTLSAFAQFTWAQCDTLELGNDILLCQGDNAQLTANPGYDYYTWSTGATTQSITVSAAGQYSVQAGVIGANLVQFGDFSGGTTNVANNFITNYIPGTGGTWGLLSNEGTYAISTSPSLVHNNFVLCGDHTTGTGNMLIANGSSVPGTVVWSQTVNVSQNQDYVFSFWATNVVNDPNVSQLQLYINGSPIGNINATSVVACSWGEISDTWNSGSSTQAILSIVNNSTVVGGNDFAIDDIYFAPVCVATDTVTVTVDAISVNAGPDMTFCPNDLQTTTATSNDPNATFSWSDGTQQATLSPVSSGTYTVTATSSNGCTVTDNVLVTVVPMNWYIDTVTAGETSCGNTDGYVSALVGGSFNDAPSFTWSGPGAGNPNSINATVWQNLSAGWYYLSIESAGCYQYDSIEVTVSNPPVASGNAIPATGTAPLTVFFDNSSQNASTFEWNFGNGNAITNAGNSSQSQVYDTVGTYLAFLVASEGACSDTVFFVITVVPPPVVMPFSIEIPNVFTPNGDMVNDYFGMQVVNAESFEVSIVNRWGNEVFYSNDAAFKWNGTTALGLPAAEGVYFYRCKIHTLEGEDVEKQGFLHLQR